MSKQSEAFTFGRIIAVFGAVLIAVGVGWLIAKNWHQLSAFVKIAILFVATGASFTVGVVAREKKYNSVGAALLVLGALLYTWSIFLIAQIYSTETTWQGTAWLVLIAWVGVVFSAYVFDSSWNLVVGLWEFIVWMILQFVAFMTAPGVDGSTGWFLAYLVAMGTLLFGIGALHRAWKHRFGRVYQWWTAFYFLAFAHMMALQSPLGYWWT
ncbi:DUF2157 domain-containing protein, partial [Candidatus Woesearchaeota archaeon]|nr:DUF2157 domain-containing protein [Candidatus Woesearchaeota archaeon]